MMNKTLIWRAVSVFVTIVLLVYLLSKVQWDDFSQLMSQVTWFSAIVSFSAYFLLNFFRALRFRALLEGGENIRLRVLFPITMYHNFLVRVLPFKIGEISYVVMMRTYLNYSMQEGISSLVGARLFELLIIVAGGVVGIVAAGGQFEEDNGSFAMLIGVSFVLCVVGLYFAGTLTRFGINTCRWFLARFVKREIGFVENLLRKVEKLAVAFDTLRQPRFFSAGVFYSIFTYGFSFVGNSVLMYAVGVNVDFPTMLAIVNIGMFSTAFPFSISGFGVTEASWALALVYFAKMEPAHATSIGFMLHGFQIVAASMYGLLGYLALRGQEPDKLGP